jgi:hypothetical protein
MRGALFFCLLAFFYLLWTPFDKASDLPVIKDSEAAQFVGQNVEVKGLVVAVHTSRKGNTAEQPPSFALSRPQEETRLFFLR